MGFGAGPFGGVPLGQTAAALPAEDPTTLTSSRAIDATTQRYVLDDEGGFEAMDDVGQRVLLLLSFELGPTPKLIDSRFDGSVRNAVVRALRPVTEGADPQAKLVGVTVVRPRGGATRVVVEYLNLTTNSKRTVAARLSR